MLTAGAAVLLGVVMVVAAELSKLKPAAVAPVAVGAAMAVDEATAAAVRGAIAEAAVEMEAACNVTAGLVAAAEVAAPNESPESELRAISRLFDGSYKEKYHTY